MPLRLTVGIKSLKEGKVELQSMTLQTETRATWYHQISNYAKFLQTPLELGMFVPCNKFNEIMTEPDLEELKEDCAYEGLMLDYKEAKDRVIFEVSE